MADLASSLTENAHIGNKVAREPPHSSPPVRQLTHPEASKATTQRPGAGCRQGAFGPSAVLRGLERKAPFRCPRAYHPARHRPAECCLTCFRVSMCRMASFRGRCGPRDTAATVLSRIDRLQLAVVQESMTFFRELKRRNLFRAAPARVLASWNVDFARLDWPLPALQPFARRDG